ncbi:MAG: diaminopropionate ammonia-lyase, partial [Burkholderiales bacterium]|nr:diaminopropionate ammonia-lyase [Burkholderiales bacterium]
MADPIDRRPLPAVPVDLFLNPRVDRVGSYGAERTRILGGKALEAARREITSWPGYAVTPLHDLRGLAGALGIGQLHFKDEGGRFGLGSFKALGGAYAVGRLLAGLIERETGTKVGTRELAAGAFRDRVRDVTVTCATDGNHGRSVAWGARMFGCKCVIYIHENVSEGRKAAIESFGAEVVRTPGNYDDAVRQADADARQLGRHVISDTSYEGYMDIPRDVMQGYGLMAEEALEQMGGTMPTHVFLQGGVGGMAAAVCSYFWERADGRRPI